MTYDAGDRKSIRKAEKAAKITERARLEFVGQMMSTLQGRSWAYDLLVRCHIFANPFSPDALLTAFGCGEMNIGQTVLADIMQACPDQYVTMMREATIKDAVYDRHHSNDRSTTDELARSSDSNGGVEGSSDSTAIDYDPYSEGAGDYGAQDRVDH